MFDRASKTGPFLDQKQVFFFWSNSAGSPRCFNQLGHDSNWSNQRLARTLAPPHGQTELPYRSTRQPRAEVTRDYQRLHKMTGNEICEVSGEPGEAGTAPPGPPERAAGQNPDVKERPQRQVQNPTRPTMPYIYHDIHLCQMKFNNGETQP